MWHKACALVVNVDESNKPGSHWVAIYVDQDGSGVFFDSYGLPPSVSHHIDRLRRNSTSYRWNIQQLQSVDSDVCGHYCVVFLFFVAHGYSLDMFCTLFCNDTISNDRLVLILFNRIVNHRNKKKNNHLISGKCKQSCRPKKIM